MPGMGIFFAAVTQRFQKDNAQTAAENQKHKVKHAEKDGVIRAPDGQIPGKNTVSVLGVKQHGDSVYYAARLGGSGHFPFAARKRAGGARENSGVSIRVRTG
jgi:hypothetical protein